MHAGAKSAKPLLGNEENHIWWQAADALAAVDATGVAPSDDEIMEVKTKVAERLMEAEASAFQKRLNRANPADAQWLQQVRFVWNQK